MENKLKSTDIEDIITVYRVVMWWVETFVMCGKRLTKKLKNLFIQGGIKMVILQITK